jgi:hypothetical protein
MASPTQRTLKYLREQGYRVAVVEHWNQWSRTRQDMFGIIDVVAIGKGITIGVQCTSAANVSARVHKIADHESTPWLREANWQLEVHGWKKGKRGPPRIVDVS